MKDRYVQCYIDGRHDPFDGDVDLEKIVERVSSGGSVRDTTLETARKEINREMDASSKTQWLKDNLEVIREMGGDTEKAYRLYVQGRTDQLAHDLEVDVVDAMSDQIDDSEDEDDDGEDDPDEDDDED